MVYTKPKERSRPPIRGEVWQPKPRSFGEVVQEVFLTACLVIEAGAILFLLVNKLLIQ